MKTKILPLTMFCIGIVGIAMGIMEEAKGARMAANAVTDMVQQEVCTNQALSKVTLTYVYNDGSKLITDHYCVR